MSLSSRKRKEGREAQDKPEQKEAHSSRMNCVAIFIVEKLTATIK